MSGDGRYSDEVGDSIMYKVLSKKVWEQLKPLLIPIVDSENPKAKDVKNAKSVYSQDTLNGFLQKLQEYMTNGEDANNFDTEKYYCTQIPFLFEQLEKRYIVLDGDIRSIKPDLKERLKQVSEYVTDPNSVWDRNAQDKLNGLLYRAYSKDDLNDLIERLKEHMKRPSDGRVNWLRDKQRKPSSAKVAPATDANENSLNGEDGGDWDSRPQESVSATQTAPKPRKIKPSSQPPPSTKTRQRQPVGGVQRPSRTQRVTKTVSVIRDRTERFGKRVFKESDSPLSSACLLFGSMLSFLVVFSYVVAAFVAKRVPVIVPETMTLAGVSCALVFLRAFRPEYWLVLSILSIAGCSLSFAANVIAFRTIEHVTYAQVINGTYEYGSHLNRTVTNPTDAYIDQTLWDGTKAVYVFITFFEAWSLLWLLSLGCYKGCFSSRNRGKVYPTDDDDDDDDDDEAISLNDKLEQTGVRGTRVLVATVRNCTNCRCWDLSECCPRRRTKAGWYGNIMLYPLYVVSGLAALVMLVYAGYVMAAVIERIPFWTTFQSPHYLLIVGLVVMIVPPVGETFYIPEPKTSSYDDGDEEDSMAGNTKNAHVPRMRIPFLMGWIVLFAGVVMSGFALEYQRLHAEATTGATWLVVNTYQSVLNCTSTSLSELTGGYVLDCAAGDVNTRNKLVTYSFSHHVLELLLVIIGALVCVLTFWIWCFDFSSVYGYSERLRIGPKLKQLLPPGESVQGLVQEKEYDPLIARYFNELIDLVQADDRALAKLSKRDQDAIRPYLSTQPTDIASDYNAESTSSSLQNMPVNEDDQSPSPPSSMRRSSSRNSMVAETEEGHHDKDWQTPPRSMSRSSSRNSMMAEDEHPYHHDAPRELNINVNANAAMQPQGGEYMFGPPQQLPFQYQAMPYGDASRYPTPNPFLGDHVIDPMHMAYDPRQQPMMPVMMTMMPLPQQQDTGRRGYF